MKKLVVSGGAITIIILIGSAYLLLSKKELLDKSQNEGLELQDTADFATPVSQDDVSEWQEDENISNITVNEEEAEEEEPLNEEEFKKELEEVMADDIWETLLTVKYRFYQYQYIPEFNDNIKKLENTEITLKGYMYPLSEHDEQEFFILSYYPIAQCFFCGGAGPESVMEVNAKTPIKLRQKAITIKGKLKLNADDPERLFFILMDAERVN